jgi:MFS family permease
LPLGADAGRAKSIDLQAEGFSLVETIRTMQFWLVALISFCYFFLANVFLLHIVIHAIGLGIPATVAASILSVGAGVTIGGRILIGGIADQIGNRMAVVVCFTISLVAFALLLIAKELWTLYLFAVIFGLGSWSVSSVLPPLSAELFGLRGHGAIFATIGLATMAGGATGPLVAGIIYDVSGSYQMAFAICIAVCIIAIIAATLLRPLKNKQAWMTDRKTL